MDDLRYIKEAITCEPRQLNDEDISVDSDIEDLNIQCTGVGMPEQGWICSPKWRWKCIMDYFHKEKPSSQCQ